MRGRTIGSRPWLSGEAEKEIAMIHDTLSIRTASGECPTHIFRPDGLGVLPAIIFYMDAFGVRPTLFDMCERLAQAGYVVLLPDLFYRAGSRDQPTPAEAFSSQEAFARLMKIIQSTDNLRAADDTGFLLSYLDSRQDIKGEAIGVTGYCMGGAVALSVAGTYPDRVIAAASFHAGALVTDQPTSPHLLAPKIRGRVYVAGADKDEYYPPAMAEQFEAVLSKAGVNHRCEIYAGAMHGFTMKDVPVYNEAAAERHWRELLNLVGRELR
jgi:carboxymethylenebutenolidase